MKAARRAASPAKRPRGAFGEQVRRGISNGREGMRACDRRWTFPFVAVGLRIESPRKDQLRF